MHPDDAAARGIAESDPVRVFNELGEVHCPANLTRRRPPRHCRLLQRRLAPEHLQRLDANALVPDTLTDLGGGACFNDARVQVALLGRH